VTFLIAGIEKTLRVWNLREAQRNGTSPFFYFQYKIEDFEKFPKTYFISYDSKTKEADFDKKVFDTVWGHISFIKTWEILKIVISLSEKVIFFVYIVLSYIGIFTFLAFLVALLFLQSFKNYKRKVLSYLWSVEENIQLNFNFEYGYLILLWFTLSILVSFVLLLIVFRNIDYFSLELKSLGLWIGLCILYLMALFWGFKIFWK
jgi:predicted lysophospholipase L1 biosynthesis ABC-type transport system permease subunit